MLYLEFLRAKTMVIEHINKYIYTIVMKNISFWLLIIILIIPIVTFSQDLIKEKKELYELKINDSSFFVSLDTLINTSNDCLSKDHYYCWEIFVGKDTNIAKGLIIYVHQSLFEDGILEDSIFSKGFFYYRDILFIVREDLISNLFDKTGNAKEFFIYKRTQNFMNIFIFDPAEFIFNYCENKYKLIESIPCGR